MREKLRSPWKMDFRLKYSPNTVTLPRPSAKSAPSATVRIEAGAVPLFSDRHRSARFDAIQVLLEPEIDNARQRIRTINSGGAAGYHIDAIQEECRDRIKVNPLRNVKENVTATVDQHQSASRAKAAQIQSSKAATGVVREAGRAGMTCGRVLITCSTFTEPESLNSSSWTTVSGLLEVRSRR
jgi:hypothetical protein